MNYLKTLHNQTLYDYDTANRPATVTNSPDATNIGFGYDIADKLTGRTYPNGVNTTYDALGRRVSVQIPGQGESEGNLTRFIYDGQDVVMDDDTVSGITKYQNGFGVDNKLYLSTGGVAKYFLADQLGSTNGLADGSGNLLATTDYDSFGNATNSTLPTRYQFTGREFDSTTGLQYSRARWYDPNLGRFMSEDPIGFAGGDINLFGYVKNKPLMFRDPRGLSGEELLNDPNAWRGLGAGLTVLGGYAAPIYCLHRPETINLRNFLNAIGRVWGHYGK